MSLPVGPINEQYQTPAGAGTSQPLISYYAFCTPDEMMESKLTNCIRCELSNTFNGHQSNEVTVWLGFIGTEFVFHLKPYLCFTSLIIGPAPLNVAEYERYAKDTLSRNTHGYYASGSNDMITLRENREAYSRLRLMPKILIDVSTINTGKNKSSCYGCDNYWWKPRIPIESRREIVPFLVFDNA